MMPRAERYLLQVPFRGARNYLQLPDIFDALWRQSIETSVITIKRPILHAGILVQTEPLPNFPVVAIADVVRGNDIKRFHIYDDDKAATSTRVPDTADQIATTTAVVDIRKRSASMLIQADHEISPASAAVSVVKVIHHHAFPQIERWFCGCIKYHRNAYLERQPMAMRAQIKQVVGGVKITETSVLADDEQLFTVFFTPRP